MRFFLFYSKYLFEKMQKYVKFMANISNTFYFFLIIIIYFLFFHLFHFFLSSIAKANAHKTKLTPTRKTCRGDDI